MSSCTATADVLEITAPDGKLLYNMSEALIAITKTITCEGAHGRKVLTVKKKWSGECTVTSADIQPGRN